jgi:hypothetical protein
MTKKGHQRKHGAGQSISEELTKSSSSGINGAISDYDVQDGMPKNYLDFEDKISVCAVSTFDNLGRLINAMVQQSTRDSYARVLRPDESFASFRQRYDIAVALIVNTGQHAPADGVKAADVIAKWMPKGLALLRRTITMMHC